MGRRRKRLDLDQARAVAYVRASTADQQLSPQAQVEAIGAWCESHGIELVAGHRDEATSGTVPMDRRPGLLAAAAACRELDAGILCVTTVDRLSRDLAESLTIRDAFRGMGARVAYVHEGGIEDDSPDGRLTVDMRATFAQYERGRISLRTKVVLRHLRAQGRKWNGTAPYGWRWRGRRAEPDEIEAPVVELICAMRKNGASLHQIRRTLDERDDCPPRGVCWHVTSICRILERQPSETDGE